MANTKISQLPSWTGTAADLRWFVMNNSGENETFKFSGYTSPFKQADNILSIVPNYLPGSRATGNYSLVGGEGTTTSNDVSSIVWGKNLNVINGGEPGKAIFGSGNSSIGGGNNMLFGSGCINNGYYSIAGGEGVNNYGNSNATFGRSQNNSGGRGFMAGNQNTISDGTGTFCMGQAHQMATNGGYDSYNSILGGDTNKLNYSMYSVVLGGRSNNLSGNTSSFGDFIYGSAIVGGTGNTINGNLDFIAAGKNNTIKNNQPTTASYNSIINGYSNQIGNFGGRNTNLATIINGYSNAAYNNGSLVTIIGSHSSSTDGSAGNMMILNSTNGVMDGSPFCNIVSSSSATLKSNGYSGIYNSSSSNIPGYSPYYSVIMGGSDSNIGQNFPNGGGNYKGLYNTETCNVYGTGHHHAIFNGKTNTINSTGGYNTIINGEENQIIDSGYASIVGGKFNKVSGATNYSGIFAGISNTNNGNYSVIIGGESNQIKNTATEYSSIVGAYSSSTEGDYSHIFGGIQNVNESAQAVIVGGRENFIASSSDNSEMLGCRNSVISGASVDVAMINTIESNSNGYDRIAMIATSGRTATVANATFVENLVVFNYANLDFADDTAAAAGGVVLGQVYHNAGALRIRVV